MEHKQTNLMNAHVQYIHEYTLVYNTKIFFFCSDKQKTCSVTEYMQTTVMYALLQFYNYSKEPNGVDSTVTTV